MDKRRRRNEEGRERQTGEMREWEMGGRERAGHSFPFSPWFSVRVAQEDKAKRSVSLLWNNPFCVSPPFSLSLSPTLSRYCLSLCLMAQLRFLAMPLVIWLISGGMVYWHHLSNTIYSHPIKSKPAPSLMPQSNSANMGHFSLKNKPSI